MKIIGILILIVLVASVVFLGFVYSGFFNVAATSSDPAFVNWIMSTTSDKSIERHAKTVALPNTPPDTAKGFEHYDAMCVACHGAPGVSPDKMAKGLNPPPPELDEAAAEFTLAELFWTIKNGIKWTGMPAFGTTYPDENIWAIAAFVQSLPSLNEEQYAAKRKTRPTSESGHEQADVPEADTGEQPTYPTSGSEQVQ